MNFDCVISSDSAAQSRDISTLIDFFWRTENKFVITMMTLRLVRCSNLPYSLSKFTNCAEQMVDLKVID
jgi:hypothetical protein